MTDAILEVKQALDEFRTESEKGENANKEKLSKLESILNTQEEKSAKILEEIQNEKKAREELDNCLKSMELKLSNSKETKSQEFSEERKSFDHLVKFGEKSANLEKKYLRTDNNENGGYLVPVDYRNEIIKNLVEITPFRQVARTIVTSRNEVYIPTRSTEPTVYWVGEGGSMTETQSKYGLEKLPTNKIAAYVDATQEMLSDSAFNIGNEIMSDITEKFAQKEGTAFISGTGVAQPEGILTNSSVGELNTGSATSLTADAFYSIQGEFKTGYVNENNLTWMLSAATLYKYVRTLKDGTGQYLLQIGLAGGVPNTIAGRPYILAPDMPAVSAGTYPVALGDWRQAYIIVDKTEMMMLRDDYTQATSGKVRFVFHKRVGGQVVKAEAIKKMKVSV